MTNRFLLAASAGLVIGATLMAGRASAQEPAAPTVLLVLDRDAIDFGPAPHLLPADAVDPERAGIGVRDELAYFQSHVNGQVVLTSGQNGNDGWFALRTSPASWATGEAPDDGLDNFALAGPGLGSPDDEGNRESLLENVADVTPLRAAGLSLLVGRMACAVVYSGDIAITPGEPVAPANLTGPTFGRVAFSVVNVVPTDDPDRPNVLIQIAEGHEACAEHLAPFAEAP